MNATTTAPFTAARVQGRYRVLDEAGQIVVTLNSKAKAEARAAELNDAALTVEHADNMTEIDAALAVLDTATEEAQVEETAARAAEGSQEEPAGDAGTSDTPAQEEEPQAKQGPSPEVVAKAVKQLQAELDAAAPAIAKILDEPLPGEEAKPAKAAKGKGKGKGKTAGHTHTGQPEPHAFTTVGTTIKNHCTDCGRTWAAAAHRKFREAQETAEVVDTEGEWTPAEDDTTPDGKAPAESAPPGQTGIRVPPGGGAAPASPLSHPPHRLPLPRRHTEEIRMTPTLYLAWLSHPEDGGYFDPEARDAANPRFWRKHGPLHLSLHTRRDRAEEALKRAAEEEWKRADLSYAHGPFADHADRALALEYMVRHIGYDAHVTEQPVDLP
jgi:hypothetical protein